MQALIFLQAQGNPIMSFVPLLLMLLVIYFFFMRPQMKKQKEQGAFVDNIKVGDEVVMNSGILGRITKIEGNVVKLAIDQKNYMRVLKGSISKEMTEALAKGDSEE